MCYYCLFTFDQRIDDNGRKFAYGENRQWSGEESPDLGWSSYGILGQRREEFFNGGITNESSYRSSWEGRPEIYSFVESLSEPLYYFFFLLNLNKN